MTGTRWGGDDPLASARQQLAALPWGTVDPGTGISWGGVRANGVRLDLSRDLGGAVGFWGSAQQHLLTGKNVPDNWRTRLMGGAITSSSTRPIAVPAWGSAPCCGTTSRIWGLYPGAGGLLQPAGVLLALGAGELPAAYPGLVVGAGGSGSWSYARTDDSRRYPLEGLLPSGLPDRNAPVKGAVAVDSATP